LKQLLLLIVFTLIAVLISNAQPYNLSFEKNYGGSFYDWPAGFVILEDSSMVIAAQTNSNDYDVSSEPEQTDYWIYKIDKNGELLWDYTYGGESSDIPKDMVQTSDGGFVIAGYTVSEGGDISINYGFSDMWVIKVDSNGLLEWELSVGGSYDDAIIDIGINNENEIYFAGLSTSDDGLIGTHFGVADYVDIVFGKISQEGELLFIKVLGTENDDESFSVMQNVDGNYLLTGYTKSPELPSWDGYIIELSEAGELVWVKLYGGSDYDLIYSIAEIGENEYYFSGYTYSDDGDISGNHSAPLWQDMWVGKIDSIGNLLWSKCYGGTSGDEGQQLLPINDSSFIVSGFTASPNNGDVFGNHYSAKPVDIWIVEMDTAGIIKWSNCFGGYNNENFYNIQQLGNGYVVQGVCRSTDGDIASHYGDSEYPDVWIFKLDKECDQMLVYPDQDDDTYGDSDNYSYSCTLNDGFVLVGGDCDDNNPFINPGATEILNGIDDDCNQIADDGLEIIETELIGLSVFPNPATNELTIQFENINTPLLTIYNINGDLIFQQNKIQTPFNFDASELSAGLYLIYLYAGNLYTTTVFVKD